MSTPMETAVIPRFPPKSVPTGPPPPGSAPSVNWADEINRIAASRGSKFKGRIPKDLSKYPGFPRLDDLAASGKTEEEIAEAVDSYWRKHRNRKSSAKLRAKHSAKKAAAKQASAQPIDPNALRVSRQISSTTSGATSTRTSETTTSDSEATVVDAEEFTPVISRRKRRLENSASKAATPSKKTDKKATPPARKPPGPTLKTLYGNPRPSTSKTVTGKTTATRSKPAPTKTPNPPATAPVQKQTCSLATIRAEHPFAVTVCPGRDFRSALGKEDFNKLLTHLQDLWLSGDLPAKTNGTLNGDDDSTIILCADEESRRLTKLAIHQYVDGEKTFRGWDLDEDDGLVEANAFLGKRLDKYDPVTLLARYFNQHGIEGTTTYLRKVAAQDVGRVVYFRLSKEAADLVKENNGFVGLGFVAIQVKLGRLPGAPSTPAEDMDTGAKPPGGAS